MTERLSPVADPEDPPCSDGAVIGWAAGYLRPIPATCQRWACDDCGKRKARKLAARISQTDATRFLTLTARAQPERDLQGFLDELNAAWRHLWKRIQRAVGERARGYVKVIELTAEGTPHLHIALDAPYLSQAWLQDAWSELTGYYIVDIRRIWSERQLARYLGKYLTKTHTAVPGRRKWSATPKFLPPVEVMTTAPDGSPVTWEFAPTGSGDLLNRLRLQGWTFDEGWWRAPRVAVPG